MNKNWHYPKETAYKIGEQLKNFRARTEETAFSEYNLNADHDRSEVVRQIDWAAFDKIIEQLQFNYLMDKKYKG